MLMALRDCMNCAGMHRQLEVHQETSLFSLYPDLVVLRMKGAIVLVVAVKAPGATLFSSEGTAGQVLNYALGLQQGGISRPLVCLSSYNDTVLCSLPDIDDEIKHIWDLAFESDKEKQSTGSANDAMTDRAAGE